jgi:hypothetical protein
MASVQKQTQRPMKQNRISRHKNSYSQQFFNKGAQDIQWRKAFSSTSGKTGYPHVED